MAKNMEDYPNFANDRLYGSFLEINGTQQNSLSGNTFEDYLDAYGQKIKNIADMLIRTNLNTLKKEEETFQTIVVGIQDVISNLSYMDNILLENVLTALYEILDFLYIAGERAGENDFSIRSVKFSEFLRCHRSLVQVAKQLCKEQP